ncbi:kinase-like domain-containing protein [Mycena epipterygia]|nr:kinase-like domain-containing protein [Mycena epipterygia]
MISLILCALLSHCSLNAHIFNYFQTKPPPSSTFKDFAASSTNPTAKDSAWLVFVCLLVVFLAAVLTGVSVFVFKARPRPSRKARRPNPKLAPPLIPLPQISDSGFAEAPPTPYSVAFFSAFLALRKIRQDARPVEKAQYMQDLNGQQRNKARAARRKKIPQDLTGLKNAASWRVLDTLAPDGYKMPPDLDPTTLTWVASLGYGTFGNVNKVRDEYGRVLAIKRVRKRYPTLDWAAELTAIEVLAHRTMETNPAFPTLRGVWEDGRDYILATDCAVQSFASAFGESLGPRQIVFYAAELLVAIHALHQHGLIHRDIKPDNLLVDSQGHLQVTDFGLAAHFGTPGDHRYADWNVKKAAAADSFPPLWAITCPHQTRAGVGTPGFMAPEVNGEDLYSYGSDFWNMGATIYYWAFPGQFPYRVNKKTGLPADPLQLRLDARLSPGATSFFEALFEDVPLDRLSVAEMKDHAFFGAIDWAAIAHRTFPVPAPGT